VSDTQKRIFSGILFALFFSTLIHFGLSKNTFSLTGLIDRYENLSYDARLKSSVSDIPEASIEEVVIIDIEQNSIESLGHYFEWPHSYHGQLIDVVSSGNPKALLFDIIFDKKDNNAYSLVRDLVNENTPQALKDSASVYLLKNNPDKFVSSTLKSVSTYHALVFEPEDTLNFLYKMDDVPHGYDDLKHTITLPENIAKRLPNAQRLGNTYVELLNASHGAGAANFPQDEDGIIRRTPTAIYFEGPQKTYLSLSLAATKNILKIPDDGFIFDFDNNLLILKNENGKIVREIPIDDKGRMYVNYFGYHKTFYYIPYMYAFDPEMLDPAFWEGKIAIVGSSLPGLMDLRSVPVQETFPGVEIHANVIHGIINDTFIKPVSSTLNFLAIFLLSIIIGTLAGMPKKPMYGFLFAIIGSCCWILFAYSQFVSHLIIWEIIRPVLSSTLTQLSVFSYAFIILDKDKRFLRSTFGTYISPKLIDQMIDHKAEPQLGGEEGYHTAFFTDIQSFSAFSEKLTASELVALLNQYLTDMTDVLLEHNGTLDKYIGDAIVAFYGAPIEVKDHELWACKTAIKMQENLDVLRQGWQQEGDRWPEIVHNMQNRIGISSGQMVTGNMGSEARMNYTMMGDNVNTAARLESSAKQYGIYIQIADSTYQPIKDKVVVRDLDNVRVMGKNEPVKVWELISEVGQEPEQYKKILPAYHEALDLYKTQEWEKAIEAFKASDDLEEMFGGRKTNPSRIYIPRCEHYLNSPPGDDWDGVWTLTSK